MSVDLAVQEKRLPRDVEHRGGRPRVAAIVQEYFKGSHADKLVTKLFRGFELLWVPQRPAIDITALYIEHVVPNDIGVGLADEFDARVGTSIRDALTVNGELAVEGVVIIGDQHPGGGRPDSRDERGFPVDPRARYFREVAEVFREVGRTVPVFVDKQLGCTWEEAKGVYDLARAQGIPLMAGSSIPVNYRFPPTDIPWGSTVEEVVIAVSGSGDTPPYHMLEVVESMVERRRGYETGVATVQFLSGESFWNAWTSGDRWSKTLQEAAQGVSPHVLEDAKSFYDSRRKPAPESVGAKWLPELAGAEEAILVEYRDGMRVAVLLLNGYMLRRNIAIKVDAYESPIVTTSPTGGKVPYVPMAGPLEPAADHPKPRGWYFDHLAHFIERFVYTREVPYPLERTLLVGGIIDAAMTSRYQDGAVQHTPHLAISYAPAGAA